MLTPGIEHLIDLALEEDAGLGDVTSRAILPATHRGRAVIRANQDLIVCGLDVATRVFLRCDPSLSVHSVARDGDRLKPKAAIFRTAGSTRSILMAERTALNFLQRLSGIATQAARYAAAVEGTGVRILDTRKTTPAWRALEKYAVRTGGCVNHRSSLGELILIKDNHLTAAGSLAEAVRRCRATAPGARVEVEADSMAEVREACRAGADIILLDNMTPAQVRAAVAVIAGRAQVEVSGGISLETVRSYALPGVDFISVGALTHSVAAVDISLDLEPAGTRV